MNQGRLRRRAIGFVVGAVCAGSVSVAHSAWIKQAYSDCIVYNLNGTEGWFSLSVLQNGGPGLATDDSSGYLEAYCAFPETSSFDKSDVEDINVHIYDGSTAQSAFVNACWFPASTDDIDCSNTVTTQPASNTGHYTMSPNPSVWDTSQGFAEVLIALPSATGGGWSTLKGVYYDDTP